MVLYEEIDFEADFDEELKQWIRGNRRVFVLYGKYWRLVNR
jgi:hypothetical protein